MPDRILRLDCPWLPPEVYSSNSRAGIWAKRGKKGANNQTLDDVRALVMEQGWEGPPMKVALCKVHFTFPQRRKRDHGSFVERMKPVWDALVRLGVLEDDNLDVIGWPRYSHGNGAKPSTIIAIREMEE